MSSNVINNIVKILMSTNEEPMCEEVARIQAKHVATLATIDDNNMALPSRKAILPPISALWCVTYDPKAAKNWASEHLEEFKDRCRWEQDMRADFVYGLKERKNARQYANVYINLAKKNPVKLTIRKPETLKVLPEAAERQNADCAEEIAPSAAASPDDGPLFVIQKEKRAIQIMRPSR